VTDRFVARVVEACRAALPPARPLALHEPRFDADEWRQVKECLDTGWVSTAGRHVDLFEARLADITGATHAVATVNGTAALHVCLLLAGVRPGDEVLLPSLTFVATANAVAYCGAVPHFVDCDEATLAVDPQRLADHLRRIGEPSAEGLRNRSTGRNLRALIVMHTFGHPADLDPLVELARTHGIVLVEDAAESLGTTYRGKHTGTRGRLAALSFNGNKIVTTGGGGAVLTSDPELGRAAKHLTTTARVSAGWRFVHDQVGYNYRLPNLNAALGVGQLARLDDLLARKRELARRYRAAFEGIEGVRMFVPPAHGESNHWLNAVLLDRPDEALRDALLTALNAEGIAARPAWTPMHTLPMYSDSPRDDLRVTESLCARIVNLPSSAFLAPAPD
jgi:perosamine synthetase